MEESRKYEIFSIATDEYNKYLIYGKRNLDAIQHLSINRGLSLKDIKDFKIGFCPSNYRYITPKLLKLGYTQEEIEESGLANCYTLVDNYAGYIIIPNIIDGRTVHITGRYIGKRENARKHRHINGGIKHLYNIGNLDPIKKKCIVVESPLDAIILSSKLNFPNVFANYGALPKGKGLYNPIKDKEIYILFDEDTTGEKEALHLANFLWKEYGNSALITKLNLSEMEKDITDFFLKTRVSFKSKMIELLQQSTKYTTTEHYSDFVKAKQEKATKKNNKTEGRVDKESVKDISIFKVVNNYIPGYKGDKKISCPFHGEKEPSFTLFENTNRFFCFGCGAKGDNIELVRMFEQKKGNNISFVDAIRLILSF